MRVEVAWVGDGNETLVALDLPEGANVDDAVARALPGVAEKVRSGELVCAIFGRRVARDTLLRDGDRVEVTRPLVVDAKTARRRRAAGKR